MRKSDTVTLPYACADDPASRVQAALRLYAGRPIGVKWSGIEELEALEREIDLLDPEDKARVALVRTRPLDVRRGVLRDMR